MNTAQKEKSRRHPDIDVHSLSDKVSPAGNWLITKAFARAKTPLSIHQRKI
jgi:hypothetical protein